MINGIRNSIGALTQSIRNIADSIRSYLHFSVPDQGPLVDYQTWMPDFIGGLAKSIEGSRGMIQSAMEGVSSDMVLSPNVTAADALAGGGGGGNSSIAALLGEYLPYLPQLANMSVVADTGALVGQLAPAMNVQLGVMAARHRRE